MTLAMIFWMLFILWLILGLYGWTTWPPGSPQVHFWGGFVLLTALLFFLGWGVFGFVIKG
jgi:hypothetical protein